MKLSPQSQKLSERLGERILELECSDDAPDRMRKIMVLEAIRNMLADGTYDYTEAKEALEAAQSEHFNGKPAKPAAESTKTPPPPELNLSGMTSAPGLLEDSAGNVWDDPEPLPGLPSVPKWAPELAAEVLAPWLVDISERIQCPTDFPPVPAYIAASALIGTKCGIRPKERDHWLVVPNLWGMCIGRPSAMKTPPAAEVLAPIKKLNAHCREDYDARAFDRRAAKAQIKALEKAMDNAASKGAKERKPADLSIYKEDADNFGAELAEHEARKRYMVQDITTQRLGEILSENPQGVMLYRDELKGWLRSLEMAGREQDRAFYLECWNGNGSFLYDRVERGEIPISAACVSIYGTIQPRPLNALLRGAVDGTADDDGLVQRLQLAVYPDKMTTWENVDEFPDSDARRAAWSAYERLAAATAEDFGAITGDGPIPYVRFTPEAQRRFNEWRTRLENRLLQSDEHPAFEAHLTKYRSLIPSLALVNQLLDVGRAPVELESLERAILYSEYLEGHARRIYSAVSVPDVDAAKLLLKKLRAGRLPNPFQEWRAKRPQWTGLTDGRVVSSAIEKLIDFGWLQRRTEDTDGRSRADIYIHPDIAREWTR